MKVHCSRIIYARLGGGIKLRDRGLLGIEVPWVEGARLLMVVDRGWEILWVEELGDFLDEKGEGKVLDVHWTVLWEFLGFCFQLLLVELGYCGYKFVLHLLLHCFLHRGKDNTVIRW
jgi:hypothetical protein